MAQGPPPNYYSILGVTDSATSQQIRDGYKKAALKTHPDRVAADSPERAERTRRFQLVNDAYYTLSDTRRRSDYDAQRKFYGQGFTSSSSNTTPPAGSDPFEEADEEIPAQGGAGNAYSWAWDFFTKSAGGGGTAHTAEERQRTENAQFSDVFEEMMREEGMAEDDGTNQPTGKFWSIIGGLSGSALGFIVANVPGMVAGAVAGNRLGAVRDTKGKSVYAVFQELPQADRARMLGQLAARVFSHAVGV